MPTEMAEAPGIRGVHAATPLSLLLLLLGRCHVLTALLDWLLVLEGWRPCANTIDQPVTTRYERERQGAVGRSPTGAAYLCRRRIEKELAE